MSNDPVPLRQFSSGNSNDSFGENFTSYSRTSMFTSNLFMRKKENNNNSNNNNKVTQAKPQQLKLPVVLLILYSKIVLNMIIKSLATFLLDGLYEDLNQDCGNPPLKELSEEAEEIREKLSLRIASSIEWKKIFNYRF